MQKIILSMLLLFLPAIALPQASSSLYQVATITQVKPHLGTDISDPTQLLYEVSVKISGQTYVVLTNSPSGDSTILYAVGRELLVHVEKDTITWNDILGQSHEVQIVGRGPMNEISRFQR